MTLAAHPTEVASRPRSAARARRVAGDLRAARRFALPVLGAVLFVVMWEWTGRAGTFGKTWVPLTAIYDEFGVPGRATIIKRAASATLGRAITGLVGGFLL